MLAAWTATDACRAVTDVDRSLGPALENARVCVLENLGGRDGHNAAALLGRLIAARGGSASFVSGELDTLAPLLSSEELVVMRAALFEGYARALADESVLVRDRAWEPPACVVPLGDNRVAIAGGFPNDSADALVSWADRVASWAVRAKVRRAVLSGPPSVRAALHDALSLVGVEVDDAG